MDVELISHKELTNDHKSVYLYLISNMWIAYGKSAYVLRSYIHTHGMDSICGFSDELNLPFTAINLESCGSLRESLTIRNEKKDFCIEFVIDHEINQDAYTEWAKQMENMSFRKDSMKIITPVSQLICKNGFLADSMLPFTRSCKRFLDCLAACLCLLVMSPLFFICCFAIKKEDGGPIFFKQERIGRFGKPFTMYKFRSMCVDAEKMGPQLSHSGGKDDLRLTKVGKFIREHHIDELPQLWNVILGDMALVGPRPERKFFIDQIMQYDKRYVYLYQIRPGVTSEATLYNGYTDTMEKMLKRLEYDLYYLGHRSLWFDTKVLFKTVTSLVFGKKL